MELSQLIIRLEAAGGGEIPAELRKELAKTTRPFAPLVRAAILNIPVKGPKSTGLRLRIARCVQTWAEIHGNVVSVGIEVNPERMPDGQKALPLYMDGDKAPWRHPVYGNREVWVTQEAHPYFWDAVSQWGPATARAVNRVADKIAAQITA